MTPGTRWRGQALFVTLVLAALGLTTAGHLAANSSELAETAVVRKTIVDVRAHVTSDPKPLPPRGSSAPRTYVVNLTTTSIGVPGLSSRQEAQVHLVVFGAEPWRDVAYGATIEVRGRLTRAPDQGARERLHLTPTAEPVQREAPGGLLRPVGRARDGLVTVTDGMSEQARGLVPGIGIGDTSRMPPDLTEAMRVTGLTHITAVSGSHFAIISGTVLALTLMLRCPRAVRILIAASVMAGFVVLVRPEPSVARAAVMGGFALAGMGMGRPAKALAALAACVVGLLLADPWLARSYGFVLSVVATAALVVGVGPLTRALARRMPRWLALAIAVPTLAQAACGPIIILLEPRLAVYAVPANLLAVPALGPASICGVLAAVLATSWPWAAGVLAMCAAWATEWIAWVATFFAGLPGAQIAWPAGMRGAGLLAMATLAGVLAVLAWPFLWSCLRWGVQEIRGRPQFLRGPEPGQGRHSPDVTRSWDS